MNVSRLVPCGACAGLVWDDEGCGHWHPGEKAETARRREAARAAKLERDRQFAELKRMREQLGKMGGLTLG